ncbi:NUDIX hydrolase [Actinoplanes derwentensis]|uniref:8-oxo-dGTP diphosphatase n=1 Tax=Actinoplanes derwentensis TaxID=113562 RepID=A0A1H1WUC5_9ACTN|nr:NUDIX domain-containing protein [Actinoplanes derwentensis]GID86968.1 DNA mismatch repair protein MutT [Actinoplanes derwentensis]SDT00783.1 NUDIX domain-containing protein [Actinoplanes derwentensis]
MSDIDKVAWVHLVDGRVLSTRNRGKDVFYFPGGKREAGESDLDTLVREIREELDVAVTVGSAELFGVFTAAAHGHPGRRVRMTCYTADYVGQLRASSEIEEFAWLTYADRGRVSPVDQLIFDRLW